MLISILADLSTPPAGLGAIPAMIKPVVATGAHEIADKGKFVMWVVDFPVLHH